MQKRIFKQKYNAFTPSHYGKTTQIRIQSVIPGQYMNWSTGSPGQRCANQEFECLFVAT